MTFIEKIWAIIKGQIFIQPTPTPILIFDSSDVPLTVPVPNEQSNTKISTSMENSKINIWAHAIAIGENNKQNNPGNLKYTTLSASWGGTKGFLAADGGWICDFPTYALGFTALCNFLTLGAENELLAFHSSEARTLVGFTKIYAGNPPQGYISGIVEAMGGNPDVDISTFLS